MRWFFAYGKPWFVASAFIADKLLGAATRTAHETPTAPPSLVFKLHDSDGRPLGDALVMTQETADQRNAELTREGREFRWLSVSTGPREYWLFDTEHNNFCDIAPVTVSEPVAEKMNENLKAKGLRRRWVIID